MTKIYRIAAGTLAVLGSLAAIGVGAMIVATAILLGGVMALAAKLALKGTSTDATVSEDTAMDAGQVQA